MRKLLALLILLVPSLMVAQTVRISASSVKDSFNRQVSGQLCFAPVDATGTATGFRVGTTQVVATPVCGLVSNGVLQSGLSVYATPTGVYYHITAIATPTGRVLRDYGMTSITGTPWSLDSYDPHTAVLPLTTVVGHATSLPPGSSPTATLTGGGPYVLDIGVPQGATGATGATGPAGPAGTSPCASGSTSGQCIFTSQIKAPDIMLGAGAGGGLYIDARYYGVIADGTTDNSTPLQNAVNAACAYNAPRDILLPVGNKIVYSQTLVIPQQCGKIRIHGPGNDVGTGNGGTWFGQAHLSYTGNAEAIRAGIEQTPYRVNVNAVSRTSNVVTVTYSTSTYTGSASGVTPPTTPLMMTVTVGSSIMLRGLTPTDLNTETVAVVSNVDNGDGTGTLTFAQTGSNESASSVTGAYLDAAWDFSYYGGGGSSFSPPSGMGLENMTLSCDSSTKTALLNQNFYASQGYYATGSYGFRAWRAGRFSTKNLLIEGCQYGVWGIEMDLTQMHSLELLGNHVGVYLGPRSDQAYMDRLYTSANDIVLQDDSAKQIRITHMTTDSDGSSTTPVFQFLTGFNSGTGNFICDDCWLESFNANFTGTNMVEAGISTTDNTNQAFPGVFDITFRNPKMFGNKWTNFMAVGNADGIVIDHPETNQLSSLPFNNFLNFVGSKAPTHIEVIPSTAAIPANVNNGTGRPQINQTTYAKGQIGVSDGFVNSTIPQTFPFPNSSSTSGWYLLGTWTAGSLGDRLTLLVNATAGTNSLAGLQETTTILVTEGGGGSAPNLAQVNVFQAGNTAYPVIQNNGVKIVDATASGSSSNKTWQVWVNIHTNSVGTITVIQSPGDLWTPPLSTTNGSDPGSASANVVVPTFSVIPMGFTSLVVNFDSTTSAAANFGSGSLATVYNSFASNRAVFGYSATYFGALMSGNNGAFTAQGNPGSSPTYYGGWSSGNFRWGGTNPFTGYKFSMDSAGFQGTVGSTFASIVNPLPINAPLTFLQGGGTLTTITAPTGACTDATLSCVIRLQASGTAFTLGTGGNINLANSIVVPAGSNATLVYVPGQTPPWSVSQTSSTLNDSTLGGSSPSSTQAPTQAAVQAYVAANASGSASNDSTLGGSSPSSTVPPSQSAVQTYVTGKIASDSTLGGGSPSTTIAPSQSAVQTYTAGKFTTPSVHSSNCQSPTGVACVKFFNQTAAISSTTLFTVPSSGTCSSSQYRLTTNIYIVSNPVSSVTIYANTTLPAPSGNLFTGSNGSAASSNANYSGTSVAFLNAGSTVSYSTSLSSGTTWPTYDVAWTLECLD